MELWYKEPASYWEEALPLGNGRLGAMVWSGTAQEKISLNEDSLWSGYPQSHDTVSYTHLPFGISRTATSLRRKRRLWQK